VIVLQYIARPCGELFVKLFFRFFRFFFDTRCKALTARDADLAKLAFDNAALPLCGYWRVPDRYLIRTVGLRAGHRCIRANLLNEIIAEIESIAE
jgi:hypothetical protein